MVCERRASSLNLRRLSLCLAGVLPVCASAQVTTYTDEAAFLGALAGQGFSPVHESFEDEAAWGTVRSTIPGETHALPSVTSLGITWSSSSPRNEITTGPGPARTGDWGFYSVPHGEYESGIGDGFAGTSAEPLVAIGGWVETNTAPAKLAIFLDGNASSPADFGDADVLDSQSRFFGVIDPGGFARFDFRELEGTIGDQKLIFADDFTFAFGRSLQDCNSNGIGDALDITQSRSLDCNANGVPDECEIEEGTQAPGGPFFCIEDCAADCNANGLLDACEVVSPETHASGALSPIGAGFPKSFTIAAPPPSKGDVVLEFTAHANLGGVADHIAVDVNGVPVGTVFGPDGSDCPEGQPDSARLVIPMATFNDAVGDSDAVIHMVASAEVAPDECDLPSTITVTVTLLVPSDLDVDGNGVPDTCETAPPRFQRGDCNDDGAVELSDAVCILGWLFLGDPGPDCDALANTNGDGSLDLSDGVYLLGHLFLGDPAPPPPYPDCGPGLLPEDLALGCENAPSRCRP